jgi:hypothetical protein
MTGSNILFLELDEPESISCGDLITLRSLLDPQNKGDIKIEAARRRINTTKYTNELKPNFYNHNNFIIINN